MTLRAIADDLAADFAACGPLATCQRLALQPQRAGRTVAIRCPWHDDATPSCTITIGPERTIRAHCFSCGESWDVLSLIARVERLDIKSDFRRVVERGAEIAGRHDLLARLQLEADAESVRQSLTDVAAIVAKLKLSATRSKYGVAIACPTGKHPGPCYVSRARSGAIWAKCKACGWSGDVIALVGAVRGLEHEAAVQAAAEIAHVQVRPRVATPLPPPPPRLVRPSAPEPTYPDREQVLDLLGACVRVNQDEQVAAWLASRGLDADAVAIRDLALALPRCARVPPWARFRGRPWTDTGHRLIVPLFDSQGLERSVHACRVVDGSTPKRIAPAGHKVAGLIMADTMTRLMLAAGRWPEWAAGSARVVVCEGEPDWLTWAVRTPLYRCPAHAVMGIIAGSWTDEIAAAIPMGAAVVIWTDHDRAGERYATQIAASLRGRCSTLRGAIHG